MSGWGEGYVTEIGYTHGYQAELKPLSMRQALISQGIEHRWPRRLHYLELGFGQGLSLNIHAAAMDGEFWGCDINPSQAANALNLASASGADVRIFDSSFEELLGRSDLPTFDVIALHGIWSWVSDANRRLIVELARRHLAVGGVFYVSYNTSPGWSAAMPLRQLLALHAKYETAEAEGLPSRLSSALDFAQALADGNAAYFRVNPAALEKLDRIRRLSPVYSVHEYLTADWHLMSFADMARQLSDAKLAYATTSFLLDQVDAFYLTADQQKLMQGISHSVFRECVRDYLINQQFRRDLWIKGPRPMAPFVRADLAMSQTFALTTLAALVPMKGIASAGEVELHAAVYRPVIDALADQAYAAKSLRQLCASIPTLQPAQIAEAVTILSGLGHVAPTQSLEAARAAKPACDRLNAHLMRQALHSGDAVHLASPLLGGGVAVNRFHQLFLGALKGGKTTPAEWVEEALAVLLAQGQLLSRGGKPIATHEESIAELREQASVFEQYLPVLRALQVA